MKDRRPYQRRWRSKGETREVEQAIRSLLREISSVEESEIPATLIGEWVMRELAKLDQVAYVRFASVYRQFQDVNAFREEIERLETQLSPEARRQQLDLLDDDA